jgi:hypothetical protein
MVPSRAFSAAGAERGQRRSRAVVEQRTHDVPWGLRRTCRRASHRTSLRPPLCAVASRLKGGTDTAPTLVRQLCVLLDHILQLLRLGDELARVGCGAHGNAARQRLTGCVVIEGGLQKIPATRWREGPTAHKAATHCSPISLSLTPCSLFRSATLRVLHSESGKLGTTRGEPAQGNESESLADTLQHSRVGVFIRARHYASSSTGL